MKFKMKIRQKFKFTATAAILAFGVGNKGYTQNTSQAVMSVQVNVTSGSQTTNNTISNISDQLQNPNSKMSFGNFKLQLSDGADFIVKKDNSITMKGENSNWLINTNLTKEKGPNGRFTLRMSGNSLSNVPSGNFEGNHLTEIHYL